MQLWYDEIIDVIKNTNVFLNRRYTRYELLCSILIYYVSNVNYVAARGGFARVRVFKCSICTYIRISLTLLKLRGSDQSGSTPFALEIYLPTLIASIVSTHPLTFESLTALTSNSPIIEQFSSNRWLYSRHSNAVD